MEGIGCFKADGRLMKSMDAMAKETTSGVASCSGWVTLVSAALGK